MFNSFCKICIIVIAMRFFTNIRSVNQTAMKPAENTNTLIFSHNRIIPTSAPRRTQLQNKIVVVNNSQTYEETVAKVQNGKKIKWGEPFWIMFHVLAEKIRESEFLRLRAGLLNLVYTICSNLPCPECTSHALQYLNAINFNSIYTKDDFKYMLYNFHNSVNVRKEYPIFPKENLDKYKYGNLMPIIENFMQHFLQSHKNFHLIADDIQRKRISDGVKKWFQLNITSFH